MGRSMRWEIDSLSPTLDTMEPRVNAFLAATMEFHAPQAEAKAKTGAPWTDRTTNARNALSATAQSAGRRHRIILAHGVPYGIWLEVRWSGRYAILEPTIRSEGAEVMKTIEQGLLQIFRGGR